ncbi:MAG: transcriptional regulator [Nevskiaceae bacterium]|nr:MAG: transcriptional regulator [Nevskiaceae bacterium]
MNDFIKAEADMERVNAMIGRHEAISPDTAENRSRDRLLRAKLGLSHLLTNVIPNLEKASEREEIFLWVRGVFTIIQVEECEAITEGKA